MESRIRGVPSHTPPRGCVGKSLVLDVSITTSKAHVLVAKRTSGMIPLASLDAPLQKYPSRDGAHESCVGPEQDFPLVLELTGWDADNSRSQP
ncbi:unnamed protein product [Ixodes pacificus]